MKKNFDEGFRDLKTQELRSHLTAIVESSDDAILSKDLDGIILSWNEGAERIFGYTADETVGKSVTMLIPPGREEEEPEILRRIRKGERIKHYETIRRKKDGSLINISLTISPIKNAAGKVIGASKIARDITERKKAEALLKETGDALALLNSDLEKHVEDRTASLNRALSQMQEFSYSVSHDLRGPIRAITAYSTLILQEHNKGLDADANEFLHRIIRGATRMDKLISDVLVYARINDGKIECKNVLLQPLIKDIIEQYPEMQPPHMSIQLREPLLSVWGNESVFVQVVTNLLTNAKKFVANDVMSVIEIWTESQNGRVRIFFKDNGIGIDPEHHSRLFQMFERVESNSTYAGTGIGLVIVRKGIERMGGQVGVESDGSNGSTFWIDLNSAV